MATAQQVLDSVRAQKSVVDSIAELVRQLRANQNDPAALDQILTELEANTKEAADAMVENTSAAGVDTSAPA